MISPADRAKVFFLMKELSMFPHLESEKRKVEVVKEIRRKHFLK
jgi:hypothetical protein